MNPRKKNRLLTLLGMTTLLSVALALVLYSLDQNIDLFYTPSELVQGKNGVLPVTGQRLRLGGLVVENSVQQNDDDLSVRFQLEDDKGQVDVQFTGLLPDLFREGQGIVTTGKLNAQGQFVADEVIAKHDENYMPPEVAEATKGIVHHKPQAKNKSYAGNRT